MRSRLEDVVVAETILSDVDGTGGRLTIRGHPLEALAGQWSFEGVVRLLFDGFLDGLPDEEGLRRLLGEARADVFARCAPLLPQLSAAGVYAGARAGMALMPDVDSLRDALRLVAVPAVLGPAIARVRQGHDAVAPDPTRAHAADVLRMLQGTPARADLVTALDTYFVTVCDHGLNPSTFAARVVASTRAGLGSAVLAGLGALDGPLHGGAAAPVIAMLDAIAVHGDANAWFRRAVRRGERLAGFGHRIYRVRDPRADVLKATLRVLDEESNGYRLAYAERVEQAALDVLRELKPTHRLETTVDFYAALLLDALDFPPDAFTCVFAMSRVAGWIAHACEQRHAGGLIRPQARYVGRFEDAAARKARAS